MHSNGICRSFKSRHQCLFKKGPGVVKEVHNLTWVHREAVKSCRYLNWYALRDTQITQSVSSQVNTREYRAEYSKYQPCAKGRHICSLSSRWRQPSHVCDRPLQTAIDSCRSILAAPVDLRLVESWEYAEYTGHLGNTFAY